MQNTQVLASPLKTFTSGPKNQSGPVTGTEQLTTAKQANDHDVTQKVVELAQQACQTASASAIKTLVQYSLQPDLRGTIAQAVLNDLYTNPNKYGEPQVTGAHVISYIRKTLKQEAHATVKASTDLPTIPLPLLHLAASYTEGDESTRTRAKTALSDRCGGISPESNSALDQQHLMCAGETLKPFNVQGHLALGLKSQTGFNSTWQHLTDFESPGCQAAWLHADSKASGAHWLPVIVQKDEKGKIYLHVLDTNGANHKGCADIHTGLTKMLPNDVTLNFKAATMQSQGDNACGALGHRFMQHLAEATRNNTPDNPKNSYDAMSAFINKHAEDWEKLDNSGKEFATVIARAEILTATHSVAQSNPSQTNNFNPPTSAPIEEFSKQTFEQLHKKLEKQQSEIEQTLLPSAGNASQQKPMPAASPPPSPSAAKTTDPSSSSGERKLTVAELHREIARLQSVINILDKKLIAEGVDPLKGKTSKQKKPPASASSQNKKASPQPTKLPAAPAASASSQNKKASPEQLQKAIDELQPKFNEAAKKVEDAEAIEQLHTNKNLPLASALDTLKKITVSHNKTGHRTIFNDIMLYSHSIRAAKDWKLKWADRAKHKKVAMDALKNLPPEAIRLSESMHKLEPIAAKFEKNLRLSGGAEGRNLYTSAFTKVAPRALIPNFLGKITLTTKSIKELVDKGDNHKIPAAIKELNLIKDKVKQVENAIKDLEAFINKPHFKASILGPQPPETYPPALRRDAKNYLAALKNVHKEMLDSNGLIQEMIRLTTTLEGNNDKAYLVFQPFAIGTPEESPTP